MRISLAILALIASCLCAQAQTGAAQTPTYLNNEVNTLFANNTSGAITPEQARQTFLDMIASTCNTAVSTCAQGSINITGTPSVNFVPIATSATAAAWGSLNTLAVAVFGCSTNPSMLAFTTSIACATVLPTGLVPAFTGDVTNSAGSLAFTIANGAVTGTKTATNTIGFGNLIQGALNTTVCNPTGGTANFQACTPGQISANHCLPNVQVFTTGTAATYTTPTCNSVLPLYLEVELVGGGASTPGSGTSSPGTGTAGNNTTFGTFTAGGGATAAPGLGAGPAAGGAVSGCDENIVGGPGSATPANTVANYQGAPGGNSTLGGAGGGASSTSEAGGTASANTGSGGGAPGTGATASNGAPSGAAGGTCRKTITSPASTYTYTVGAATTGGSAGTNGATGGNGAAGRIKVVARWQ